MPFEGDSSRGTSSSTAMPALASPERTAAMTSSVSSTSQRTRATSSADTVPVTVPSASSAAHSSCATCSIGGAVP